MPKLLTCTMATDRAVYVDLNLQWRDLPLGEFRCWQPDPLSAILLLRTTSTASEDLIRPSPPSAHNIAPDSVSVEG